MTLPRILCSSPRNRVLEFVRRYFRGYGAAPSFDEIGREVGIPKQRVGRHLRDLQREGLLRWRKGERRSITLVDRMANMSDEELLLACIGRGWRVETAPVPQLAGVFPAAYPVEPAPPEWGEVLRSIGEP